MRCIEICDYINRIYVHFGLTLTWDVLKYIILVAMQVVLVRLTLTWDVLKFWESSDIGNWDSD